MTRIIHRAGGLAFTGIIANISIFSDWKLIYATLLFSPEKKEINGSLRNPFL